MTLQLVLAARATIWWGGGSFGPRILTEILPGMLVLAAVALADLAQTATLQGYRWFMAGFLALGSLAAVVHIFQGLYNPAVQRWNEAIRPIPATPSEGMGDLFAWEYTQILATNQQLCQIRGDHAFELLPYDQSLSEYEWGSVIGYDADLEVDWQREARLAAGTAQSVAGPEPASAKGPNEALLIGFQQVPPGARDRIAERWTRCKRAYVLIQPTEPPPTPVRLRLSAFALECQRLSVAVNGVNVGHTEISCGPPPALDTVEFSFDAELIHPGRLNQIELFLPDTRPRVWQDPLSADTEPLGIALIEMWLGPDGS
jgi:hypothetical protein